MLNAGTVQAFAELNDRGFRSGLQKMKRQGDRASSDVERRFDRMGTNLARIGAAAAAAIGAAFVATGIKAVKTAAKFEDLRVAMDTLNRSAVEGERNFKRLVETAANTPFQLTELARAQNTLQGFGLSADEAYESLLNIGDIAAVSSGDIQGISIAFGQAAAEGKAMTRDIRQFINQGVPMISLLADTMGVAKNEVLGLAEEGKISFEVLQRAFKDATSAGGLFEDGMLKAQKTLSGAFSNLKDNADILLASIGELTSESFDLEGKMRGLADRFADAAKEGSELRDVLSGLSIVLNRIGGMKGSLKWIAGELESAVTGGLSDIGKFFGTQIIDKLREIGKEKRNVDALGVAVADLYEKANKPLVLVDESNWTMVSHIKEGTNDIVQSTRNWSAELDRIRSQLNEMPTANIYDPTFDGASIEPMERLNDIVREMGDQDFSHRLSEGMEDIGKKAEEATPKARLFAHTLADGLQGVFFQAQNVQDAIQGIIRQLASRALTAGIFSLFGVGGGFAKNFFGGSFHTGGVIPGVGEKQVSVQGGEMILTKSQQKSLAMGGGGSQSVNITVNVQGSLEGRGDTLRAVIDEQVRQSLRLRG